MNKDPKGLRRLCAQIHDEDGRSPRLDRKNVGTRQAGRKDRQLCKQVQRALDLHLAGAVWASLAAIRVGSVEPDPDATRLRVAVQWNARELGLAQLMDLLSVRRGELRTIAAAAITRKRAPQLVFTPWTGEEVADA